MPEIIYMRTVVDESVDKKDQRLFVWDEEFTTMTDSDHESYHMPQGQEMIDTALRFGDIVEIGEL